MNKITTIIIDIREEFELLESHIEPITNSILVINIPTRAIFANKKWIKDSNVPIHIICKSGNRSNNVKNTYFKDNKNVKSVNGGIKKLEENPFFKNKVKIVKGKAGLGLQQYLQLVFICLLSIILLLLYLGVDKKNIMIFISMCILFIGYQVYTQGCWLSSFLPLSDF